MLNKKARRVSALFKVLWVEKRCLLAKKILHPIQPALGFGVVAAGIALAYFFKFAQQFFLPVGEAYRGLDDDMAKQVAMGV